MAFETGQRFDSFLTHILHPLPSIPSIATVPWAPPAATLPQFKICSLS